MYKMRLLKWSVFYGILLLLSLAIFVLYVLGIVHLTDQEGNTCEMTYMFEYPQYVRISLEDEVEDKFPRYALYAYGEGFVTERLRKMKFTGIPVLFVPGNAGSHEQVRSLASISLRKSLKDRTTFHFDYFTVSLGKDYSALYGGVLMDETIYVSHCINKIFSLYQKKVESIVLIGHSMGGIVAKGAILMTSQTNASHASILITLATPHKPIIILDSRFAIYYNDLDNLTSKLTKAGTSVISIGGGHKDILVTSAQTIDQNANISTLSTGIPAAWISTDHLCILWCKQLLLVIVRALFDCVDITKRPARIIEDPVRKIKAFSYHLIDRYSGKRQQPYQDKVTFEQGGKWVENIQTQYVWKGKNNMVENPKDSTVFLMINLSHFVDHVVIDTFALEAKDWLFACNAFSIQGYSRACDWGWNLTNYTRIFPDPKYNLRKIVDLNLEDIRKLKVTHVVVKIPPDNRRNVVVNVDMHSQTSRIINIFDDTFFNGYFFWRKKFDLIEFSKGSIRYYLNLTDIRDAVTVKLEKANCLNTSNLGSAIVELIESWNPTVTQIKYFTQNDNGPKTLKMQQKIGETNNSGQLRITLDPTCSYSFQVKRVDIIERMSLTIRENWPILYQLSIALLLLAISLKINSNYIGKIGITILTCAILGLCVECCVLIFILHLMAISICCFVIFLGSIAHNIAARFLARAITFSVTWSDWLIGGLNQLPLCTTVIVLSIIPATCGALAMLISVFLYFLKLTRMYEDYLEELLISSLRYFKILKPSKNMTNNGNTKQKIFNNLLLFMLLCFTVVPAVPSVLVWAKNFSVNTKLTTEDPVLLYSWIVLIFCSMMDFMQIPCDSTFRTQVLGYFLYFLSSVIIYAASTGNVMYHQWWIPPIVSVVAILISLNSLIP